MPNLECAYFLGWRPVGSVPIFPPEHDQTGALDPRKEAGKPEGFDQSKVPKSSLNCIHRVEYRARVDGLYLMKLHLQTAEIDKRSPTVPTRTRTIRSIAGDIGMVVKSELGHPHYFHGQTKAGRSHWLATIFYIVIPLVILVYLVYQSKAQFSELWANFDLWAVAFLAAVPIIVLGVAGLVLWQHLGVERRLDRNELFSVRPTRVDIDPNTPIKDVPFLDAVWLAGLQTLRPSDRAKPRIAIGHMRRTYLKIAESTDFRVAEVKSSTQTYRKWFSRLLLWPLVMVEIVAMIWGLWSNINGGAGLFSLQYPLFFGFLLLAGIIASLIFSIQILNLPVVRVLRAAQGFFKAANPINDAIARILWERDRLLETKAGRSLSSQPVPVSDFDDVADGFAVKLSGETQRLQMEQFWAAIAAALLGLFVTAFTISTSKPQPPQDEPAKGTHRAAPKSATRQEHAELSAYPLRHRS